MRTKNLLAIAATLSLTVAPIAATAYGNPLYVSICDDIGESATMVMDMRQMGASKEFILDGLAEDQPKIRKTYEEMVTSAYQFYPLVTKVEQKEEARSFGNIWKTYCQQNIERMIK